MNAGPAHGAERVGDVGPALGVELDPSVNLAQTQILARICSRNL